MKKIICGLVCVVLAVNVFAGSKTDVVSGGEKPLTIYALKGPSGVGLAKIFETKPVIPGFAVELEALPSADLMAARIISGEALIGVLPANTAAKIVAGGIKYKVAAVIGNGMIALLSSDASIKNIEGLRGKKVAVAGHGAVPEYVFRKILGEHGLGEADVSLDFSLVYPEIAAALIAGRIDTALLPEPFAEMARNGNPKIVDVVSIDAEWKSATGKDTYPLTVVVVESEFARNNPKAVEVFLKAVEDSQKWVVGHPKEAGQLVESLEWGLKANVVAGAIPKSAYTFKTAKEARGEMEALFEVLLNYAPESIGGAMPKDEFYLK
jgi:NitT/TauT family transport system substrate-binding protein